MHSEDKVVFWKSLITVVVKSLSLNVIHELLALCHTACGVHVMILLSY